MTIHLMIRLPAFCVYKQQLHLTQLLFSKRARQGNGGTGGFDGVFQFQFWCTAFDNAVDEILRLQQEAFLETVIESLCAFFAYTVFVADFHEVHRGRPADTQGAFSAYNFSERVVAVLCGP